MPKMRSESLVLQRDITDHSLEEAILRARSEPFFMRHSVSSRPKCELCIRLLLHNQQTNFRSGCTTELRNQLDTCINIWSQRDFVSYNWLLRCRNFIFISNIYLSSYMYVNFGSVIWNFICLPSKKMCLGKTYYTNNTCCCSRISNKRKCKKNSYNEKKYIKLNRSFSN